MLKKQNIDSLNMLQKFSREFLQHILSKKPEAAIVVALSGDLGAGKTTFVQFLAKDLGITETVVSPTFNIIKIYPIENSRFKKLIHMDAYRIDDLSELKPLGLEGFLQDKDNLVCIEWAEKIKEVLPKTTTYLDFSIKTDETREIITKV